jgi:hypothetical protein
MEQPKYQIGDRLSEGCLVIRGIAPLSNGEYLYFLQIIGSDNTFIGTESDIADVIAMVKNHVLSLNHLMRLP